MPPKKRSRKAAATEESSVHQTSPDDNHKALLLLPPEILSHILTSYFTSPGPHTNLFTVLTYENRFNPGSHQEERGPTLPPRYLERSHVLRSLSQVCRSWRAVFLGMAHERLEACVGWRGSGQKVAFYKHIGEALERKVEGYAKNKHLRDMVRIANVSITRYKTTTILTSFAQTLPTFTNLHTIHVFHAHSQMTTAIKNAFDGISLPSVRMVIIPGMCHELLKACPEVRKVVCHDGSDGGSKLVGVMKGNCQKVEEVRGFDSSLGLLKRLVKVAPNLRVIEVSVELSESGLLNLEPLKSLASLNTIYIRVSNDISFKKIASSLSFPTSHPEPVKGLKQTVEACRSILNGSADSSSSGASAPAKTTKRGSARGKKAASAEKVGGKEKERKYLRACYYREKYEDMDWEGEEKWIELGLVSE